MYDDSLAIPVEKLYGLAGGAFTAVGERLNVLTWLTAENSWLLGQGRKDPNG